MRAIVWGVLVALIGGIAVGCSVKQNNATTRLYHRVSAQFNTLYNGEVAYDEAYNTWMESTHESYSTLLPIDPIVYTMSDDKASGGSFNKSIEKAQKAIKEHSIRTKPERKAGWRRDPKAVAEQARTEYNTTLREAWLLLGRSHFYNADIGEALATFGYMARIYQTEGAYRDRALLWQIRCLSLMKRPGESRQIIAQLDTANRERISLVDDLYPLVMAEHYLAEQDWERSRQYLARAIRHIDNKHQRSRLYYLLGQLYQYKAPLNAERAAEAYQSVLRLSPSPALEFATRIRLSELSPRGYGETLRTLRQMARRQRYRDQLDQIYLAMGRTELLRGDTTSAIVALRIASDTSKVKQTDYAMSLLTLGNIYLARGQWREAHSAVQAGVQALPTTHPEHRAYTELARGLDSLAPHARLLAERDSMLHLARLDEQSRLKVIDSIITHLKRQRADEERARRRDSIARQATAPGIGTPAGQSTAPSAPTIDDTRDRRFYFYNPRLLEEGRRLFRRQWGQRPLEDDWRRQRRQTYTPIDSLGLPISAETGHGSTDSAEEEEIDPSLTRAHYLDQLPLTSEAQASYEVEIEQSMYHVGLALVEHLERLDQARHVYTELLRRYPDGAHHASSLYQLYLLALRRDDTDEAERLRQAYLAQYRHSPLGEELARPNHLQLLRSGDSVASAIYSRGYDAYTDGKAQAVVAALDELNRSYPNSSHRPRLTMLAALAHAQEGDEQGFVKRLNELTTMPNATTELNELAGAMLTRYASGDRPIGSMAGAVDWTRASTDRPGTADQRHMTEFAPPTPSSRYSLIVSADSLGIQPAQLIYTLTAHGFTRFTQETLRIVLRPTSSGILLLIEGFSSGAVLVDYVVQLRSEYPDLADSLQLVAITQTNAQRIQNDADYRDYLSYIAQHPLPEFLR